VGTDHLIPSTTTHVGDGSAALRGFAAASSVFPAFGFGLVYVCGNGDEGILPMAGSRSFNGGFARRIAVVLAGCAVIAGALVTTSGTASARVTKPTITHFVASPSKVTNSDGTVIISATVGNASSCTLSSSLPLINLPVTVDCSSGSFSETVVIPQNIGKKTLKYTLTLTADGQVAKSVKKSVTVAKGDGRPPLSGVASVYGAATNATESPNTYCAVLGSNGGVDCWGDNTNGELGDGSLSGPQNCNGGPCSLAPQPVVGVGGSGTLSGAKSMASAGNASSFCALLSSGGVDCWGDDSNGELGNGSQTGVGVPDPVQVLGVGESGVLSDAITLVGGLEDYCALLTTGNVVCWGYGFEGQRGDGSQTYGVDYPDEVLTGIDTPLIDAVSLTTDGGSDSGSYCAVLTSGGADCWGVDENGDLGDGTYGPDECDGIYCSVFAAPVVGIGDSGTLSGVATLVGSNAGYCAVLTDGGVDCWGQNDYGQLGGGSSGGSSDSPVAVEGVGGNGLLTDVSSIATEVYARSDCALLASGGVDCWGQDADGDLGDGSNDISDVPAPVVGVNGSGTLSGVSSLFGDLFGFCATLDSGNAACWGDNTYGELGAGNSPTCVTVSRGCASPVTVLNVGGTGNLLGVKSFGGNQGSACAVVTAGDLDCWGQNEAGELGDWTNSRSAVPVSVFAPA
jgi:alpha-tubulin suppressor-like RCC1 family protein